MRVRRVRVHGHDAVLARHTFFVEPAGNELLDIVFSDRFLFANVFSYFGERFHEHAVEFVGAFDVRLMLLGSDDRFELLD